jgi:hypothetical protein
MPEDSLILSADNERNKGGTRYRSDKHDVIMERSVENCTSRYFSGECMIVPPGNAMPYLLRKGGPGQSTAETVANRKISLC